MRFRIKDSRMQMPSLYKTVVPAAIDALELDDVKEELRITHNELDITIQRMIFQATQLCEDYTNRAIITQTRLIHYDRFPYGGYVLPLRGGSIQEVEHIKIHLDDGTTKIVDPADYFLTDSEGHGSITLHRNKTWPTDLLRIREGVEIQYICGYGDEEADVNINLVAGMMDYINWRFSDEAAEEMPASISHAWNIERLPK